MQPLITDLCLKTDSSCSQQLESLIVLFKFFRPTHRTANQPLQGKRETMQLQGCEVSPQRAPRCLRKYEFTAAARYRGLCVFAFRRWRRLALRLRPSPAPGPPPLPSPAPLPVSTPPVKEVIFSLPVHEAIPFGCSLCPAACFGMSSVIPCEVCSPPLFELCILRSCFSVSREPSAARSEAVVAFVQSWSCSRSSSPS